MSARRSRSSRRCALCAEAVVRLRRPRNIAVAALALAVFPSLSALADEGGVSFWAPGQYGSFAAIAPSPDWSLPLVYYNYGGSKGAERVFPNGEISGGLSAAVNGVFVVPTYTLGTTILGAVPSFSLAFMPGYSAASANITLGPLSFSHSDSLWGSSDLYPTVQLFWDKGLNNFMAYLTGDIPVGSYDPNRLANLGIGHGAIDGGGAYTFLNTKSGTEFSATLGFTGNFTNPSTNYTNGIDSHLDLAAAQFLNQQLFVGAVGYIYQQLTPDSGQRAFLGTNESHTRGVGPQIGYNFNVGGTQIYTNIRAYWEFDSYRRLQGHSVFATVNIPLSQLFASKAQ
jgi:hypothetical protein